jgi:hypothetical protein
MAILKIESFDRYATATGTSPNLTELWSPFGSGTVSLATGRFGAGKAMQFSGFFNDWNVFYSLGGTYTSIGFGIAHRIDSLGYEMGVTAGGTAMFNFNDSAQAIQLQLCADASGNLIVKRGSATVLGVGNGNRKMMANTWHYIECEIVISDTVGVFKCWLDGVEVINLTNVDTAQTANINVASVSLPVVSARDANCYYDDMYITDGARLGEVRIVSLVPTGDTADKDWVPNSGVTNYTQVDDVVSDLDTTYVQGSVVGDLDFYALSDLPASLDNIIAVAPTFYSKKTDAGARTTRSVVKSNTDIANGPAVPETASYTMKQHFQLTDPQGGGAWTQARVNAMQLGIEVVT